jgi:outer membrane protein OmpA-like peptidoglycan-associated protein
MRKVLLLSFIVIAVSNLHAVDLHEILAKDGKVSIVGFVGVNRYDGDLDPDYDPMWILKSPNVDMSIEYNIHPILSFGLNMGALMFNQEDVNETFHAGNVYTSTFLSLDLLGLMAGEKNKRWALWGKGGVGISGLIWPRYTSTRPVPPIDPAVIGVASPPAFFIFPVGLSLEFSITRKICIGLNGSYFYTNTDHMETVYRHNYNDLWQNASISLRYKFINPGQIHMRDEVKGKEPEDPYMPIINQLQQNINQLTIRVDGIDGKLNDLDDRMLAMEGIFADGPDTDKDGVPDARDLEPNTPQGTPVDFWGRSILIPKEEEMISVYFDFDSSELDKIAQITIIKVAEKMRKDPTLLLEVRGYTDSPGSNPYNDKLSQLRANRVKLELMKVYGIDQTRITANGKGKLPDPASKTLMNRRCDFFFSK